MEIIRERIKERERIVKEAKEWARSLSYRSTVILIGSYARGDFNKWSDIDIIVISNEITGSPLERLRKVNSPVGYEVIVWTTNEFKLMIERRNPLALEAIENGIFLRDDYNLYSLRNTSDREGTTSDREGGGGNK